MNIARVRMIKGMESVRKMEALFREVALVLEDHIPPKVTTLPTATGKTPTTSVCEVDLATTVDGGSGDVHWQYAQPGASCRSPNQEVIMS